MILRIVVTIVLIALIIFGYFYIKDMLRERQEQEFRKYSGVITETSVAAELYRNKRDSFPIVRDSILRKYNVTLDEMLKLKDRYKDDPSQWAEFWKIVSLMTDSAVKECDSLMEIQYRIEKRAADSAHSDSI